MKAHWPWILVGVIVLSITAAVLLTDRCYAEEHRVLIVGSALGWFLAFVLSRKVIRVVLLIAAVGFCLLYQHSVEFTPSAEFGAVSTLRRTAASVQAYKQNHLTEGYPTTIPTVEANCRARNAYEFRYSRESSFSKAVADRFILVAVAVSDAKSRGLRSFALTEDGHLYATGANPDRPANRTDHALE